MTHKHRQDTWSGYSKVTCVEIGPTVCLRRVSRSGKPDGYTAGFIISHDVEGQPFRCEGFINIDPELTKEKRIWTVTGTLAGGDLTLSPSVECIEHKDTFHAYVREGKWTGA